MRATQHWVDVLDEVSGLLFRPVDRHGHIAASRLSDKTVALVARRVQLWIGL